MSLENYIQFKCICCNIDDYNRLIFKLIDYKEIINFDHNRNDMNEIFISVSVNKKYRDLISKQFIEYIKTGETVILEVQKRKHIGGINRHTPGIALDFVTMKKNI